MVRSEHQAIDTMSDARTVSLRVGRVKQTRDAIGSDRMIKDLVKALKLQNSK